MVFNLFVNLATFTDKAIKLRIGHTKTLYFIGINILINYVIQKHYITSVRHQFFFFSLLGNGDMINY